MLVLEDDFYLAEDIAAALREAGAQVLGPYADQSSALAAVEDCRPDLAFLDVNLGPVTSFDVGRKLKSRGIPLLFSTGYDAEVIPSDLSDAAYLIKPIYLAQLVSSLTRMRDQMPGDHFKEEQSSASNLPH